MSGEYIPRTAMGLLTKIYDLEQQLAKQDKE